MTLPPFQSWIPGMPPEEVSAALFDGALLVVRGLEPVIRLGQRVCTLIEDIFETRVPMSKEAQMSPDQFRKTCRRARRAVQEDRDARRHWQDTLTAIGYEPDTIYADRIRLRVVPSAKETHGRVFRPLPAHRDTWGSGIMAQINWWLPVYPLVPTRTMVIWPEAFRTPIANDSAEWDYHTLMQGNQENYPLLPVAREAPAEPGCPVLVEPGALLAFSAAHLHASLTDATGLSRFSVDTRMVWAGDVLAGRSAPNVDGDTREAHWEWFSRSALPTAASKGTEIGHPGGVPS